MPPIVTAVVLITALLCGLAVERMRLARVRRRLPLRIAVTGTRGKSTVTRLIAAALRRGGRPTAAKTTGSRPSFIRPDGREVEIPRFGPPTILEQKAILRTAAGLEAEALVAEMMSIGPECLKAEARMILRPNILVITNVRIDHRREMGRTRDAAASALAAAIPPDTDVFVPAEESHPAFDRAARKAGARLHLVPGRGASPSAPPIPADGLEFPENILLAEAVAGFCGVGPGPADAGMAEAAPDFGGLKAWRIPGPPARLFAVSAFAANDPDSSRRALHRLAAVHPEFPARRIGILALRADRDDRTRQWLEAAAAGFFSDFQGLAVAGDHAAAAARRLARILGGSRPTVAVRAREAAGIQTAAAELAGGDAVLIGLGNIVGPGAALVELWERTGERA